MMWDHSSSVVVVFLRLAISTMIADLMMTAQTGLEDLLQVYNILVMALVMLVLFSSYIW